MHGSEAIGDNRWRRQPSSKVTWDLMAWNTSAEERIVARGEELIAIHSLPIQPNKWAGQQNVFEERETEGIEDGG